MHSRPQSIWEHGRYVGRAQESECDHGHQPHPNAAGAKTKRGAFTSGETAARG